MTIEESVCIHTATGIPPHVEAAIVSDQILNLCKRKLESIEEQTGVIKQSIIDCFKDRAMENGRITRSSLESSLGLVEDRLQNKSTKVNEHLLNNINNDREGIEVINTNMVLQQTVNSSVFVYDNRGWDVPVKYP